MGRPLLRSQAPYGRPPHNPSYVLAALRASAPASTRRASPPPPRQPGAGPPVVPCGVGKSAGPLSPACSQLTTATARRPSQGTRPAPGKPRARRSPRAGARVPAPRASCHPARFAGRRTAYPQIGSPTAAAVGLQAVGARPSLRCGHAPPRPPPAHSAARPPAGARSPALVRVSRSRSWCGFCSQCLRRAASQGAGRGRAVRGGMRCLRHR